MTYRSEKLRRAVASLPCVCCGRQGATQAAHANLACFGKGMGHKASDAAIMALCIACHVMLDQGKDMTKAERWDKQMEWIAKTSVALIEAGLLEVAN
ncbi:DUF968 domain-containing protein [Cupriavidus necator]